MKTNKLIKYMAAALAVALSPLAQATQVPGVAAQPDSFFYTGKPYDADLGGYTFAYRSYDPQINRWTSADPSGFPDGANNNYYAPVPTNDFDYQGLLKWSTLHDEGMDMTPKGTNIVYNVWSVKTNDGASTILLYKYVSGGGPGVDWSYNCAGYVFGNSQYWIDSTYLPAMLTGDGHKQIKGPNYTGAIIADWGTNHVAWVDSVDSNGNVTQVTGKEGSKIGLTTSAPAGQGTGTVTYWE